MMKCNTVLMRTSLSLFSLASLFLACGKPPSSPTKLSCSHVDSTAIELTWQSPTDNISGFKIGQERDTGGFDTVATIPSNPLTYRVSNLKPATRYRFVVWAYNGKAISMAADQVACTTAPSATRPPDTTQVLAGRWSKFSFFDGWSGYLDSVTVDSNGTFIGIHITNSRYRRPYRDPCCYRTVVTGQWNGGTITFQRHVPGYNATFTGTISGTSMSGEFWENGQGPYPWSASR